MQRLRIKSLRQKSKSTRNNIAIGIASGVTALVFAVWAFTDPSGITEPGAVVESEQARVFGGLINQIKEQVAGAQEALQSELPESDSVATSTPEMLQATSSDLSASSPITEYETASTTTPREIHLYIEPSAIANTPTTSGDGQ